MKKFDIHIFVCENQRTPDHPKGSCFHKNSVDIRQLLKRRVKELGLNLRIRVNSAGCLDACQFGPAIVVYPEQIWYGNLSAEDVDEIIMEHFLGNRPVERLMIKQEDFYRNGN